MATEARHEPLPGAGTPRLRAWLESVVERGASDLLLVAGAAPALKINGAVMPLAGAALLEGDDIASAVAPALPPHARRLFADTGIADGSLRVRTSAASDQPASRARTCRAAIRRLPHTCRCWSRSDFHRLSNS